MGSNRAALGGSEAEETLPLRARALSESGEWNLKIKADVLRIRNSALNAKGEKLEPEQQPAQRVLVTEFDASMQGGPKKGAIKGEVVYESTAGQLAAAIRNPCWSCSHFDKVAWKRLHSAWGDPTAPIDSRKQLNGIRAALLETSNAQIIEKSQTQEGDMDVEHAMGLLGICRPLTEIDGNPVIVSPKGGCPDSVCTPSQPDGFFRPKDRAVERSNASNYDTILNLARGKKA